MYELHVDRNGPKAALKETDLNLGTSQMRWDEMVANGAYMAALAGFLSNLVQKPVVDKTGLTGRYSFTLRWAPDQFSAVPRAPTGNPDNLPPIFTAVREQLGLRLDSTTGPLEVLVIDHAEKPSDN